MIQEQSTEGIEHHWVLDMFQNSQSHHLTIWNSYVMWYYNRWIFVSAYK